MPNEPVWFRSINENDKRFLRDIRNANRAYFIDSEYVPEYEHDQWFKNNLDGFYVIMVGNLRAGTISISYDPPGEIGNLIIFNEFRKQGVGKTAVQIALCQLNDAGCKNPIIRVREDNPDGWKFWNKMGFYDFYITCRYDPKKVED